MEGDSRDLLVHLVGIQSRDPPAPIDLLESIGDEPKGQTTLHESWSITRKNVYNALEPLQEQYIIVREREKYVLTGYGVVLCNAVETVFADSPLDRSGLRFLLASNNRVTLLRELKATPARKATLANTDGLPSRTTVHRAIEGFVDKEWVTQGDGERYGLTEIGREILTTYTDLLRDIQAAESRSEFLYCCDETVADIPLDALADAEMVVDTPQTPDSSHAAFRRLAEQDPDEFRGLLSTVSNASAEVGDSIICSGTETELITPQRVLYNLPTDEPYKEHVRRGLEAQNFEFFVVPDTDIFPVGMALFDSETVYMGPANITQIPRGASAGTIVGSNDALVEWAETLYAEYRKQAQTPSQNILENLWQKVTDKIPLVRHRNIGDD